MKIPESIDMEIFIKLDKDDIKSTIIMVNDNAGKASCKNIVDAFDVFNEDMISMLSPVGMLIFACQQMSRILKECKQIPEEE